MLPIYLIVIALSANAINVLGQNDYRNLFRNLVDRTAHSNTWMVEFEETLTDKVVKRLESKLADILETRLVLNFEETLDEKLVLKLEQTLAMKLEDSLEEKLEIKLEKILADKLEKKLKGKLESTLETKLETKLTLPLQEKLEKSLKIELAGKIEEKLTSKLEQKFTKKLEPKLENKLEQKLEDTLKVQFPKTLALETKLEEKLAENLEEKLAARFEPYLGVKLAAKLEKKLTETLQLTLLENLETKLNEIDKTYHRRSSDQDKEPQEVEWVKANPKDALHLLRERALVAGYDQDRSPLWIIRGYIENNLVPGKLNKRFAAIAWNGKEHYVTDEIEVKPTNIAVEQRNAASKYPNTFVVLCAPKEKVKWVDGHNSADAIPSCAIDAGKTATGAILYVGRTKQQGTLTPGTVNPGIGLMIPFDSKEVTRTDYEVLCLA